jgi:hypothetical protein
LINSVLDWFPRSIAYLLLGLRFLLLGSGWVPSGCRALPAQSGPIWQKLPCRWAADAIQYRPPAARLLCSPRNCIAQISVQVAASSPTDGLWMPSGIGQQRPACCAHLAIASPRSVRRLQPASLWIGFGCHPSPTSGCPRVARAWRLLCAIGKPSGIRTLQPRSIGHQPSWWMRWKASVATRW